MKVLRWITIAVPLACWLIHIFIVVPLISMEKGDGKYIAAFLFFFDGRNRDVYLSRHLNHPAAERFDLA
jgi:hypothetical protein